MKNPQSPARRRHLLAIVAAAALLPLLAGCTGRDPGPAEVTVGVVQLTAVDAATLEGFKERMTELDHVEGRNIRYLYDGPAGGIDRLDGMVSSILAQGVDLIFVSSTPATLAVQRLTRDEAVPVVFAPVNDPLGSGIVRSLKAPGGNITGIRLPLGDDLRLQWLTRIVPEAKRVFVPFNPQDASGRASLAQVRAAAPGLGLEILAQGVRDTGELRTALAALPPEVDALFLPRDSTVEARIDDIVAVAGERRLPVCAPSLVQVRAGALFSYGFVHHEIGRQAARLADQILRGMRPAELPVEAAESYLAINLQAARRIGLEIPDSILAQAERIIQN